MVYMALGAAVAFSVGSGTRWRRGRSGAFIERDSVVELEEHAVRN
jgi:hypothetical protein